MNGLYPLKFNPIYQEKIWGGARMKSLLNKNFSLPNCGESWEISAVEGNISTVSNGFLAGNNLQELVEIYMGELVGDKVFKKFGIEFPLLIKFIDAASDLSVQVHPKDEVAKQRHNAYGKTEMWYVLDVENDAVLNNGFIPGTTKESYIQCLESGKLTDILHYEKVTAGDVFFIPAGRVHAIGKGVMLAEIQQTSDITYRIFDYNRRDAHGNKRELHTDLAIDVIDFQNSGESKIDYKPALNQSVEIVNCKYFTTNILEFSKEIEKDYHRLDSFIIYMCLDGKYEIHSDAGIEKINKGESVLIPASLEVFHLKPLSAEVKTLEVYIK